MVKVDALCAACKSPLRLAPLEIPLCYACRCDLKFYQAQGNTPIGYYANGAPIYAV